MPAVDNRGYPIKGSCDLEDVGLVSVFDSLANPQPGAALLCMPRSALVTSFLAPYQALLVQQHTSALIGAVSLLRSADYFHCLRLECC